MRYVVGQHDVWRIGVLTEMDHPKSVGDRSHIAKQGFEYIMQKRHAVEMRFCVNLGDAIVVKIYYNPLIIR